VANLSFMDFLEALGRIADIASYPTPAELVQWQEGLQVGARKRAELRDDEIPTLREYINKVTHSETPDLYISVSYSFIHILFRII
jgi:hypothetical protein